MQAYFDCRQHKRTSASALLFEQALEHNLMQLHEELQDGSYRPGPSICFAISRPRPREVWAAQFRDRIVHPALQPDCRSIPPPLYRRLPALAFPGWRGTLYAASRLEAKVRSQTQNWSVPGHYLKIDLANFFVSIDKRIVWPLLVKQIPGAGGAAWPKIILFNDPRADFVQRGSPRR